MKTGKFLCEMHDNSKSILFSHFLFFRGNGLGVEIRAIGRIQRRRGEGLCELEFAVVFVATDVEETYPVVDFRGNGSMFLDECLDHFFEGRLS